MGVPTSEGHGATRRGPPGSGEQSMKYFLPFRTALWLLACLPLVCSLSGAELSPAGELPVGLAMGNAATWSPEETRGLTGRETEAAEEPSPSPVEGVKPSCSSSRYSKI